MPYGTPYFQYPYPPQAQMMTPAQAPVPTFIDAFSQVNLSLEDEFDRKFKNVFFEELALQGSKSPFCPLRCIKHSGMPCVQHVFGKSAMDLLCVVRKHVCGGDVSLLPEILSNFFPKSRVNMKGIFVKLLAVVF